MNSCISYILLITVLGWVNINEAIRWDKSLPYQQIVKANNSGPAEFLWRYELTSDDSVSEDKTLVISCGYIKYSKLIRLVRKVNDNGQIAINKDTSKHGDVFGTRVRVYTPKTGGNNDNRVVGFVVDPVRKSDPDRYQCSASARQTTLLHEQFQSFVSTLRILDPPRFINCLRRLKPVVALKALEFTCEVVGFPKPKLQCQLLSFDDKILDKLPSGFEYQNLTERSFLAVPKEARKIRCIAEADDTGSKNIIETIEVKHEPFKPSYFLVSPHTVNSVNVTWSQIPRNETGNNSLNIEYRLTYYVQTLGKLNSTYVVIKPPINWYANNNTNYATQIVVDLSPKLEYSFTLYGRNSYGDGEQVTQLFTPIVKRDQGPTFTGPNFTNCLENLPTVISGSDLEFTCEAAGTPTPSLMCNVLSYTGAVLETIPQTGFKEQNLTRQIVEDISYTARKIKCIAKTNVSGPIEVTKDIDIKHPPFAPLEVTIERVNSTSARVQWSSIHGYETGSDAPDYKLDYYMSRMGPNNKTTAALPNPKAGERYTTFEVTGLVANEGYIMAVYGHNLFGDGQKAMTHLPMVLKTTAASRTTPSSSKRLKSTLTLFLICITLNAYN